MPWLVDHEYGRSDPCRLRHREYTLAVVVTLATLTTSQLPIEHRHDMINDATFADTILDRPVYRAHRLTPHRPLAPPSRQRRHDSRTD